MGKNDQLYVDASCLNKVAEALAEFPENAAKVVARVLYRTKDFAKVEIIRQVPKIYDTTPAALKSALDKDRKRYVTLVQNGEQTISLSVAGARLTLSRFHHLPQKPVYGKKQQKIFSKVRVLLNSGMKQLKPQKGMDMKLKNIFLMPTGANNKAKSDGTPKVPFIFAYRNGAPAKKNPKREAVSPVHTLAIPQMIMNPKVAEVLKIKISEKLAKETEQQLNFELGKMAEHVNKG